MHLGRMRCDQMVLTTSKEERLRTRSKVEMEGSADPLDANWARTASRMSRRKRRRRERESDCCTVSNEGALNISQTPQGI